MRLFISLIFFLLIFACSSSNKVYWCGDHPCINNKEKKAYFKKTMIIEIKEIDKKNKKKYSDIEKITQQAIKKEKKRIEDEKDLAKQVRLEEKRRLKEEKEFAKQARLKEKIRLKKEKKLAKQARLEEKKRLKEEKKIAKSASLKKKTSDKVAISSRKIKKEDMKNVSLKLTDFDKLIKMIAERNMFKSYPDINKIPE